MTRKDYILIARVLQDTYYAAPGVVVQAMAAALAADNPNFDSDRFIVAATSPVGTK